MKNNILKNRVFGNKFITKNGDIIKYIAPYKDSVHICYIEKINEARYYSENGMCISIDDGSMDIFSKYQESVDEDKLADEEMLKVHFTGCLGDNPTQVELFDYAFKAGLNKGKIIYGK